jgi:hypothetical protein
VGDAGVIGAFEVEGHGYACPFADEPIEEKMICFGNWDGLYIVRAVFPILRSSHLFLVVKASVLRD